MILTSGTNRPPPQLSFTRRLDKIVELLVRLADLKPGRDQYQAVKLFYLADREHFNRFGRPITYENYFALSYGPVASGALDLIKGDEVTLREANIPRLPIDIKKTGKLFHLNKSEKDFNRSIFSRTDIDIFDAVVGEFGEKSFEDLFQLTHKHAAYTRAWNSKNKNAKRAPIYYEDMLERDDKDELIEELSATAQFMR